MKPIMFFCVAFFIIAPPTFSELDPQDLNKIRLIVKEEISEAISEYDKQMKEYIDTKFEGVDTKFNSVDKQLLLVVGFVSALIILIVVTVGIPQIIMAWRGKNERTQDKRIEQLTQEIEALKQQRIVQP